jgi:hypothetical protein
VGRLGEAAEEVGAAWVRSLVIGEAEALDLADLCGPLVGSGLCEEGNGVNALVETYALEEEADRVLPEEAVEDGNLPDLWALVRVCTVMQL